MNRIAVDVVWNRDVRAPEKIHSTVLLVYLSVFCVASKRTYNQYAFFDTP